MVMYWNYKTEDLLTHDVFIKNFQNLAAGTSNFHLQNYAFSENLHCACEVVKSWWWTSISMSTRMSAMLTYHCYKLKWGESPEVLNKIWLSIIWNSSGGDGNFSVSSFDQTGTSLNIISNAPVDISWPSIVLLKKNTMMQAYILFCCIQWYTGGVGNPNDWKGFILASTIPINVSFRTPRACAKYMRNGGGGYVSPRTVMSGYFSVIIAAYCSKARRYPHE